MTYNSIRTAKRSKERLAFLASSDEEKFATISTLMRYEDGQLLWNIRRQNVQINGRVGCHSREGYVVLGLFGRQFYAHTLIWLLSKKQWPIRMDHINRIRDDNRIENLRLCTSSQNSMNRNMKAGQLSGYKGVAKKGNKFFAQITHDGANKYLGIFGTAEQAAMAYDKACIARFGEFSATNFGPAP